MKSEEQMQEWVAAQALEWFVAHRSNELTDAKREEFIDWLRASPAHVREYLALTGFSEDLQQVMAGLPGSTESLLSQARADLNTVQPLFPERVDGAPERCETQAPAASEYSLRAWLAAAAVILGAVALGLFSVWRLQAPPDYSTAHAEQRSWRMPDGSTVHLNSGTQIKVRFSAGRREVELIQGQALFQVAKDARRPFWVRTGDAAVKAVGTEFDVYRQSRRTLVSVVEGRVAVWRLQGNSNQGAHALSAPENPVSGEPVAQVDAGQQARISGATTVVSKKADEVRKTVAWLQRQVVFDHDPLGAAVEEFNRYSDLTIRITDPALSTAEVSGIFSAYDAEAFIRFLEHQPDMQVERTDKEVIVCAKAAL